MWPRRLRPLIAVPFIFALYGILPALVYSQPHGAEAGHKPVNLPDTDARAFIEQLKSRVRPSSIRARREDTRGSRSGVRGARTFDVGPAAAPSWQTLKIITARNSTVGFNGLSQESQAKANAPNTPFNSKYSQTSPSDMMLLVGENHVMQGVNAAYQIFDLSGKPLCHPMSHAQFWQIPDIASVDPTGVYDHTTKRFFTMVISYGKLKTGTKVTNATLHVAVSKTANPIGEWNRYSLNAYREINTVLGKEMVWMDYPMVGIDDFGLFITGNFYTLQLDRYALMWALDKAALMQGLPLSRVRRTIINLSDKHPYTPTVIPARIPPGGSNWKANGGAVFALSVEPFGMSIRPVVWAITNTSSLRTATPRLSAQWQTVPDVTAPTIFARYVPQPRPGQTPCTRASVCVGKSATIDKQPCAVIGSDTILIPAAESDMLTPVTYAASSLFGAYQVGTTDMQRAAVQWVRAGVSLTAAGRLVVSKLRAGIIDSPRASILYPALAVDRWGNGAMALTVVSPAFYPSAAWVRLGPQGPKVDIMVAAKGAAPFRYAVPGSPDQEQYLRWAEYHAAQVDGKGRIWMAAGYIPPRNVCSLTLWKSNWGSYIFRTKIKGE